MSCSSAYYARTHGNVKDPDGIRLLQVEQAGHYRAELQAMIRKARERLGLTQIEFAQAISEATGQLVDQSRVSRWEAGQGEPPGSAILAIADLCRVPVDVFRSRGTVGDRIDQLENEIAGLRALEAGFAEAQAQAQTAIHRIDALEQAVSELERQLAGTSAMADEETGAEISRQRREREREERDRGLASRQRKAQ